jgi:hypothetical protein
MKKIFVIASFSLFAACSSDKKEPAKTGGETTMAAIKSPYEISYSSQFAMDEPKNAESLLTLWKDWDNGNLSAHKDLFADSVELHFSDGSMMHASRDSVLASAQSYRDNFTSSVDKVDAIMAVKSTDKNENWALIWGMEKNTYKDGHVDSSYLQETWRFNKDGKADLMYQFRATGTPPKN